MMRSILIIALLVLIPMGAMAQSVPFLENVRVKTGYWDLGDLGGKAGVGVDAKVTILGSRWLIGAEAAGGSDVLGLNANYLIADMPLVGFSLYYGLGGAIYRVDGPDGNDTTLGAQAVAGVDINGGFYAEGRYCVLTNLDEDEVGAGDIDGMRLMVGYRWAF